MRVQLSGTQAERRELAKIRDTIAGARFRYLAGADHALEDGRPGDAARLRQRAERLEHARRLLGGRAPR